MISGSISGSSVTFVEASLLWAFKIDFGAPTSFGSLFLVGSAGWRSRAHLRNWGGLKAFVLRTWRGSAGITFLDFSKSLINSP